MKRDLTQGKPIGSEQGALIETYCTHSLIIALCFGLLFALTSDVALAKATKLASEKQVSMNSSNKTYIHYLQEKYGEPDRLELLNKEEQHRAAAFKFEQHRNLYIAAHVFLRKVLSYHTGLPLKDWEFHKNSYGKPFISNPEFESLQFNLSHTQGMIACVVNKKHIVGVDVESMRSLNYMKQMSKRNYTDKEHSDIFSRTCSEAQLHRFYTYWTLKEALVKALGCGLSVPLKKISFIQKKNSDWLLEANFFHESGAHWVFNNKDLPGNYQISSAVSLNNKTDTNFDFINSNHSNSQHWKEDTSFSMIK